MNKIFDIMFNPFTMFFTVVIAVIAVIFIVYETPISSGYITGKEFVPYHEWTTEEESCISMGQNMPSICTPYTAHHSAPDTWYITIENENDDGEKRSRTVKVLKDLYNKAEHGEYFMVPGENSE
ncbi:hypothetical protein LCGC14_1327800 [marine sediment metagenome]|uniref:Uncharacterized protein n=1 Tax=marine sediment metagenome TaxID=412755 RepID=A0A0F9KI30_9ZZZZ